MFRRIAFLMALLLCGCSLSKRERTSTTTQTQLNTNSTQTITTQQQGFNFSSLVKNETIQIRPLADTLPLVVEYQDINAPKRTITLKNAVIVKALTQSLTQTTTHKNTITDQREQQGQLQQLQHTATRKKIDWLSALDIRPALCVLAIFFIFVFVFKNRKLL